MAKRKKRYGDLSSSDARREAHFRARTLREAERFFNQSLRMGDCRNALVDLTFASRQAAGFDFAKSIATGTFESGKKRRLMPAISKLKKMEARFMLKCMR